MEMNINNECGQCICSFSMGLDRIWVFEVPDENRGFISGWIFLFNATPYFYSVAGGSEGLDCYIANTYAEYLAENEQFDLLEPRMGEEDVYHLNDDMFMDFIATFDDAMMDAGFTMEESGRWTWTGRRKHKRQRNLTSNTL
jgi:hypothetical protein